MVSGALRKASVQGFPGLQKSVEVQHKKWDANALLQFLGNQADAMEKAQKKSRRCRRL
jgi:hypothetical protein